jgi:tetratricopeptide (TPR) repeat protein
LGLSYFDAGDYTEALASYTKAIGIEMSPEGGSKEYLALFLNNRGLTYYHMDNYEDSIKDYDDAI